MKTKTPTKIYRTFDVVLVPFPFIDSGLSKKRPALIISSSKHFNKNSEAYVMAMITSALHSPWPLDLEIQDLKSAGLPVRSIIRMKLFTLDHRLIIKQIGKFANSDRLTISNHLKLLFSEHN